MSTQPDSVSPEPDPVPELPAEEHESLAHRAGEAVGGLVDKAKEKIDDLRHRDEPGGA